MSFSILRPQIKTLLESISEIQQVAGYPTLKFTGFPSAYVVPSDNSADYETTDENIRTYSFIVRVFYETKRKTVEEALDALDDIVDSVVDKFDQEDLKSDGARTLGVGLPGGYTFINIWASPSNWGEVESAELLMAEINVSVRISVEI